MQTAIRIGVLTVSDRASRGEYEDLGGPQSANICKKRWFLNGFSEYRIVSDDRNLIAASLTRNGRYSELLPDYYDRRHRPRRP
jgi:molybdopterin adenylyltransferase